MSSTIRLWLKCTNKYLKKYFTFLSLTLFQDFIYFQIYGWLYGWLQKIMPCDLHCVQLIYENLMCCCCCYKAEKKEEIFIITLRATE